MKRWIDRPLLLPPLRWLFLAAATVLTMSGCYVMRAAYEGGKLLWNRTPISDQVANGDLPADLRNKLEMILRVRQFGRDNLGLNVGSAYLTTTQVHESAIVHVVMAAPPDSLEPYLWWFPIVGAVPYRGYFDASAANAEATEMRDRGYDTIVRSSIAFSSLGFFDDPVLSNLLRLDRVELAGVLIHELFHRTFFLPSHVMFNESAATWVGARGAVEFFKTTEGATSPDALDAQSVLESNLRFANFLLQEEARLLKIYRSGAPRKEILIQRQAAFTEIQRDYSRLAPTLNGLSRFDLDRQPLNNAVLLNYLLYFHDLGNFATLDRMNNYDVKRTIAQIIEIAKSNPRDPFYALWEVTRDGPPPDPPVDINWLPRFPQ